MTHLDEGQLLAMRDDPGTYAGSGWAEHLAACAACRDALEVARARGASVARTLVALDETAWDLEATRQRVRARVSEAAARAAGATSLPGRRARRTAWGASKAAGLLLVTAAGLSALPGSPVRRWIAEVVSPAEETVAPAAAEAVSAEAPPAPEEAGLRLPLSGGGPLRVTVSGAAPGTEIRVRWITVREAALFAAAGSRFTSGDGRMEVADVSGVVRVELPRGVFPVSLEVNGRILLRNADTGLEISGPVVERDESGVTFRVPLP